MLHIQPQTFDDMVLFTAEPFKVYKSLLLHGNHGIIDFCSDKVIVDIINRKIGFRRAIELQHDSSVGLFSIFVGGCPLVFIKELIQDFYAPTLIH